MTRLRSHSLTITVSTFHTSYNTSPWKSLYSCYRIVLNTEYYLRPEQPPMKRWDPRYKPKLRPEGGKAEVFGYALDIETLREWARQNAPELYESNSFSFNILQRIFARLPRRAIIIYTSVWHPELKTNASCVGVGSNENKRFLDRCEDEVLIKEYMEVLGTTERSRPRWYRITLKEV